MVANVITSMGYEVKPQLGVAGFFIDMAVRKNPDKPGEFLAAIECDGATYHSGFSVRDRDRIRQEILNHLAGGAESIAFGRRIGSIVSRGEIERLRGFLEDCRHRSAMEWPESWEDEWLDEESFVESEDTDAVALEQEIAKPPVSDDLFVEVGDRVTYCPVDDPADRHSVLIVDSESNVKMGLVNENAPLAQALLGLAQPWRESSR